MLATIQRLPDWAVTSVASEDERDVEHDAGRPPGFSDIAAALASAPAGGALRTGLRGAARARGPRDGRRPLGMTIVRRVVPLTMGWERVPKSISVHGDESGTMLVEPVPAIALDTAEGWWLLDTGSNTVLIRDPPLHEPGDRAGRIRELHRRGCRAADPAPEGDRRRARPPARPRSRSRRLARAHRRAGLIAGRAPGPAAL
jgi:hypothetical protein